MRIKQKLLIVGFVTTAMNAALATTGVAKLTDPNDYRPLKDYSETIKDLGTNPDRPWRQPYLGEQDRSPNSPLGGQDAPSSITANLKWYRPDGFKGGWDDFGKVDTSTLSIDSAGRPDSYYPVYWTPPHEFGETVSQPGPFEGEFIIPDKYGLTPKSIFLGVLPGTASVSAVLGLVGPSIERWRTQDYVRRKAEIGPLADLNRMEQRRSMLDTYGDDLIPERSTRLQPFSGMTDLGGDELGFASIPANSAIFNIPLPSALFEDPGTRARQNEYVGKLYKGLRWAKYRSGHEAYEYVAGQLNSHLKSQMLAAFKSSMRRGVQLGL